VRKRAEEFEQCSHLLAVVSRARAGEVRRRSSAPTSANSINGAARFLYTAPQCFPLLPALSNRAVTPVDFGTSGVSQRRKTAPRDVRTRFMLRGATRDAAPSQKRIHD